jgi:hypothetical protein
MKKPVPSPVIPVAGHREAGAARHDASHARTPSIQLNFRFYSAMKPGRVYPLKVELPRGAADKASTSAAPLVVKPVIPGAVVAPAEQTLDLSPSGGHVTFQVTPLAKGRLPDARVDVSQQGRLVERVRMSMRGRTQCATWVLLLLTLIVPFGLLYCTVISPLRGDVPHLVKKADTPEAVKRPPIPAMRPGGPQGPGGPGENPTPLVEEGSSIKMLAGDHGEVLQYKVSDTVRKNSPTIPWVIDEKPLYNISESPSDGLEWATWGLGKAYQFLCVGAKEFYPSFWCATALLLLTLVSLLFRRTVQATIRKKGIRLVDPAIAGHGHSAVREEPATILETVD